MKKKILINLLDMKKNGFIIKKTMKNYCYDYLDLILNLKFIIKKEL